MGLDLGCRLGMGLGLFKHPQKPLVSIQGADPDSTQALDPVSLRQPTSALPAPKDSPRSIPEMFRELGTALSPYRSKT